MNLTSDKVRELREAHGLTQVQFAQKLNVSLRTVSRWECGYLSPQSIRFLLAWYKAQRWKV